MDAFNLALERARAIGFSYIGNLDADISLPPDYYQRVLQRFESQPRLGIVGGMVSSLIDGRFVSQEVSADSVAGAVQLFHRDCFEQVGGYLPLTHGGIDAAAEITARKLGWTVRTFADIRVFEHRRTGTASSTALSARRKEGVRLHSLGYGLAFFLIRCVRRSMERPLLIGSATALYGYVEAAMRREQIVLPSDVVRYLRSEQRRKMLRFIGFGRHPY